MDKFFLNLWGQGKASLFEIKDPALEHSCAGRLLNALTLIVVIFFLGLWITAFLLLKDRLFNQTLTGTVLMDLTCVTFFGGLVFAVFIGALAGNFLQRAFWKIVTRKRGS